MKAKSKFVSAVDLKSAFVVLRKQGAPVNTALKGAYKLLA